MAVELRLDELKSRSVSAGELRTSQAQGSGAIAIALA